MKLFLSDTQATENLGAALWTILPAQCLVFLQGDLGMGKTTLVRGFLRAAGYSGPVKSPTYNLVEEYNLENRRIIHFDLYRLADPEELEWIGLRDYFEQEGVFFIEWPAQGDGLLPPPDLIVQFCVQQAGRSVTLDTKNEGIKKYISNVIKQIDIAIL